MAWRAFLVVLAFVVFVVLAYRRQWRWTGLAEIRRATGGEEVQPAKTLWDWLQLLVIPVALAGLAFVLNEAQTEREQRHEDDRAKRQRATSTDAAREDTLRAYLTQMSELMLDRRLLRAKPRSGVQAVARTATLTAVRRLDGERRGVVVQFLAEAGLLRPSVVYREPTKDHAEDAKVNLARADLRQSKLRNALLVDAQLAGTHLQGGDLRGAALPFANLESADLRGANLRGAAMLRADLNRADLRGADLRDADLRHAHLLEADLRGTDLRGSDLRDASDPNLHGAKLQGARLK